MQMCTQLIKMNEFLTRGEAPLAKNASLSSSVNLSDRWHLSQQNDLMFQHSPEIPVLPQPRPVRLQFMATTRTED